LLVAAGEKVRGDVGEEDEVSEGGGTLYTTQLWQNYKGKKKKREHAEGPHSPSACSCLQ
jgi:hypothetical protein